MSLKLNNAISMPTLGLGTFKAGGPEVLEAVACAVSCGCRLVDTASVYRNEDEVAAGLAASSQLASATFLTSKLSPSEQGTQAAHLGAKRILSRLGRADLLLIHWPGASKKGLQDSENRTLRHQTWSVLEELYAAGTIRAIGVSNFTIPHLRQLLEVADVKPAVNQVEVHPCYQQVDLREFCRAEGIAVTAYASLGCGTLLDRKPVLDAAALCQKTPTQVLLQWGLRAGCAVIPKSIRPDRIAGFFEADFTSWELPPCAAELLDGMPQEPKLCWDPSGVLKRKALATAPQTRSCPAYPSLELFESAGFAIVRKLFSPNDLCWLRKECAIVYELAYEPAHAIGSLRRSCVYETLPACHAFRAGVYRQVRSEAPLTRQVCDLIFGAKLASVARRLLGSSGWLFNDQYIIKQPGDEYGAFGWHHDSAWCADGLEQRHRYISIWCPLQDVNEDGADNGTLVVRAQDSGTLYTIDLQAGDACVLSDSVEHCSLPNRSRHMREVWMPQISAGPMRWRESGSLVSMSVPLD